MPADERLLIAPLRYWARVAEHRPFLSFTDLEGRSEHLSYGDFYDRVRRIAGGLAARGLRPGDRCVVHTGNSLGFMLSFWALQEMGAVAVPTISDLIAEAVTPPRAASPGNLAIILYTSGTTARPKGVMLGNAGSIYTATS